MGSGNLEVFKFATYLFIPLFAMLHFGDPDWYEHHVAPMKEKWWPKYEDTNKPPRSAPEVHQELLRLKNERRAKAGLPPLEDDSPVKSAQAGGVLESLPSSSAGSATNWAAGDKRWV